MIIIKNASDLQDYLAKYPSEIKLGFVPTMGALHEGHISLISRAKAENDITVCSIFINPSQFTNETDFSKYPVTLERDIELLTGISCDLLFLPAVTEIYPPGYEKKLYPLGSIENIWEGQYRPGHFQGVCEVVDRLLYIITPQKIYLGQKDYQQCIVIKKLIQILGKEDAYELVICPTVRAGSGLAMSSRNMRLNVQEKVQAALIYKTLLFLRDNLNRPHAEINALATRTLEEHGFIVDYVGIAEAATLVPSNGSSTKLIGMIAATINGVRLIDNMLLN